MIKALTHVFFVVDEITAAFSSLPKKQTAKHQNKPKFIDFLFSCVRKLAYAISSREKFFLLNLRLRLMICFPQLLSKALVEHRKY